MKKISFIMFPDNNGRITVTNTLKHIIQNMQEITVPDADITTIPLAALTLTEDSTKHCIEGYAEGKRWDNGKYTEYKFTLIFA